MAKSTCLGAEVRDALHRSRFRLQQHHELFPTFTKRGRSVRNPLIGYIDSLGNEVVAPVFEDGRPFSGGFAAVKQGGMWGFIEPSGLMVMHPIFTSAWYFSCGLCKVSIPADPSKTGYIDAFANMAISPTFTLCGQFEESFAWFRSNKGYNFIDKAGTCLSAKTYEEARDFSEGLAAVKVAGKWGYLSSSGDLIITPQYEGLFVGPFRSGIAAVMIGHKWGYIDYGNRIVIPARFDKALSFSDGLAPVSVSGRTGYIDKSGEFVIEPRFDFGAPFEGGLAKVRLKESLGFINKSGEFVIKPQYDLCGRFRSGICLVVLGDSIGYIDASGRYLWRGPYVETRIGSDTRL